VPFHFGMPRGRIIDEDIHLLGRPRRALGGVLGRGCARPIMRLSRSL
jgi:hypothetical protein